MSRTTITSVNVELLNIPLLEPFAIATGSVSGARNVLITLTLQDGSIGYGDCAPFPPSTGETQETALAAAQGCAALIEGEDAAQWRAASRRHIGSWWVDWAKWARAKRRAGELIAPPKMGSKAHPVLGEAPGTYVRGA